MKIKEVSIETLDHVLLDIKVKGNTQIQDSRIIIITGEFRHRSENIPFGSAKEKEQFGDVREALESLLKKIIPEYITETCKERFYRFGVNQSLHYKATSMFEGKFDAQYEVEVLRKHACTAVHSEPSESPLRS